MNRRRRQLAEWKLPRERTNYRRRKTKPQLTKTSDHRDNCESVTTKTTTKEIKMKMKMKKPKPRFFHFSRVSKYAAKGVIKKVTAQRQWPNCWDTVQITTRERDLIATTTLNLTLIWWYCLHCRFVSVLFVPPSTLLLFLWSSASIRWS